MGKMVSTGRGNYPAAGLSVNAETIKKAIRSASKPKAPNKYMTENRYKKNLKKAESSE